MWGHSMGQFCIERLLCHSLGAHVFQGLLCRSRFCSQSSAPGKDVFLSRVGPKPCRIPIGLGNIVSGRKTPLGLGLCHSTHTLCPPVNIAWPSCKALACPFNLTAAQRNPWELTHLTAQIPTIGSRDACSLLQWEPSVEGWAARFSSEQKVIFKIQFSDTLVGFPWHLEYMD